MTENALEAGQLVQNNVDLANKVRRMALAVPVVALLAGALAMTTDLRYGLYATALILGWTQLVGL